jgi:PAS domain S-box-containing protein
MTEESPSEAQIKRQEPLLQNSAVCSKKQMAESEQTIEFSSKVGMTDSSDPTPQPLVSVASGGPDLLGSAIPDGTLADPRYAIGRLYAEGGIGQVWLARDTQLNRAVALKTLRPEFLDRGRVRSRFLQEAQITGQLEHPGIVPVYELVAAPQSGSPFYCMRFVHGHTLVEASRDYHRKRQAGEEEPLELVSLLSAFVTVCNTVAYAHSRGVIHRDLKGENVLLGDFGEVFILDWGVAKVVGATEEASDHLPIQESSVEAVRTIQGAIVGTPAYMAPEQAEGRSDLVGSRTDIYGLGAVLYEILTGQPPFDGASTMEILEKVIRDPPRRPSELWPDVPPTLEAACLRALSKEPAGRHASAAELGTEIQTWQETQRRQAEEELRRSRERFELAVRGSQDGLWDWDLENNQVFFSPRWKSILGYADHELANDLNEWVQRLHPDERDRVLAANQAHINGATSHYEYEYRLRHKDGSYRWILARGVALRDATGKAYRMAGSHVDITARKQIEQSLREAEQRYRTIIDSVPCGILVVDVAGTIQDCNTQAAGILGASAKQLVGASVIEVFKRAVNQDGSAPSEEQILNLIRAEPEPQCRRLVTTIRGDDRILNRVSLVSCPVGSQEAANQSSVVILLQKEYP